MPLPLKVLSWICNSGCTTSMKTREKNWPSAYKVPSEPYHKVLMSFFHIKFLNKLFDRLVHPGVRMTVSQNKDIIKVKDLKFIVAKKAIIWSESWHIQRPMGAPIMNVDSITMIFSKVWNIIGLLRTIDGGNTSELKIFLALIQFICRTKVLFYRYVTSQSLHQT